MQPVGLSINKSRTRSLPESSGWWGCGAAVRVVSSPSPQPSPLGRGSFADHRHSIRPVVGCNVRRERSRFSNSRSAAVLSRSGRKLKPALRSFSACLPDVSIKAILLLALFCMGAPARADLWCTGYYPGWEQGVMPASTIDFAALTHIIHFSLVPNADGSFDSTVNVISPSNSSDIVSRAHAAGRKVLICVGGANTQAGFQAA